MSAVKGTSSRFGAIKGLITEQNDTNFEPDSMVAAENVVPEINGNLRRRGGIAIVPSTGSGVTNNILPISQANIKYGAMAIYRWDNPNRSFGADILVSQIGDTVRFFKHAEDLFGNMLGSIDLTQYTTNGLSVREQQCAFTAISGYLIIVNRYMKPLVVKCSSTGQITVEKELQLKMRVTDRLTSGVYGSQDGWGVADILYRPGHLQDDHHFDLRNAGWPASTKCTDDETGTSASVKSPILFTKDSIGVYPAIADVFLANKTSSVEEPEALDTFSPWELEKSDYSTTLPPRGHYITPIDSFDMLGLMTGEDATLETEGLMGYNGNNLLLSTGVRPYHVGALNGHVVFITKDYIGRDIIAYSKLALSPEDMEICYQEADPTADEINDIVATDGGVMPLSHIHEVVHVAEGYGGLLLFTTEGIHMLSGNSDDGFNAVSQRLTKISDIACLSANGVVKLDDRFYFWNQDGMIALGRDQYGDIKVQNLTRGTIDLFVKQFSKDNLKNAVGTANTLEGKVIYTVPTAKGGEQMLNRYKSNIVLVLDTQLGGFYYHRISSESTDPYLIAPMVIGGTASRDLELPLEANNGAYISTNDGQPVKATGSILVSASHQLLFICAATTGDTSGVAVAKFTQWPAESGVPDEHTTAGRDWPSHGNNDFVSFAEFMHKRDANLASGTNLTNIQSFFKVKDINTIAISGDSAIPEDPLFAEFSCPAAQDVDVLATVPENVVTGLRFTALVAANPTEIKPLWWCRGVKYSEFDRQPVAYEDEFEHDGIIRYPEAILYPPYSMLPYINTGLLSYTQTYAVHNMHSPEAVVLPGRNVSFNVNFDSYGRGLSGCPVVGKYWTSQAPHRRELDVLVTATGGIGLNAPGESPNPIIHFCNTYSDIAPFNSNGYVTSINDFMASASDGGIFGNPPAAMSNDIHANGGTSKIIDAIKGCISAIKDNNGVQKYDPYTDTYSGNVYLNVQKGDRVSVGVEYTVSGARVSVQSPNKNANLIISKNLPSNIEQFGYHHGGGGTGLHAIELGSILAGAFGSAFVISGKPGEPPLGGWTPANPPAEGGNYIVASYAGEYDHTPRSGFTVRNLHTSNVHQVLFEPPAPYEPYYIWVWDSVTTETLEVKLVSSGAGVSSLTEAVKPYTDEVYQNGNIVLYPDADTLAHMAPVSSMFARTPMQNVPFESVARQGFGAFYDMVMDGWSYNWDGAIPPWFTYDIDGVQLVLCSNGTRGNFYINPSNINNAVQDLTSNESKRRMLLGTNTPTLAPPMVEFWNTARGPAWGGCSVGATDCTVSAMVSLSKALEINGDICCIGASWFHKGSKSPVGSVVGATAAEFNGESLKASELAYTVATESYYSGKTPYLGPIHHTTVTLPDSVFAKLNQLHKISITVEDSL